MHTVAVMYAYLAHAFFFSSFIAYACRSQPPASVLYCMPRTLHEHATRCWSPSDTVAGLTQYRLDLVVADALLALLQRASE